MAIKTTGLDHVHVLVRDLDKFLELFGRLFDSEHTLQSEIESVGGMGNSVLDVLDAERNIRVTPLPVAHESPASTLELLPSVPIFSSDFPHFEGSPDPVGHYAQTLDSLDRQAKASFFGDNLAACFTRMGDPIAA